MPDLFLLPSVEDSRSARLYPSESAGISASGDNEGHAFVLATIP